MKKKMKFFILGLILIIVGGCGNQKEAGEEDVIKIGSMFELTGSAAAYGTSMNNAVHMAVDEINEDGGINGKQVEVVEYDTKTDETEAASLTTRLGTRDQVTAIIGPATTGSMQAAIPSANTAQVPIMSPTATDDGVLTDSNGEVHPYAWRTSFTNSFQGSALAQFANDELDAKSAVILSDNSSDYAIGLTETFKKVFDGEIVASENFSEGETDFSAVLTNIKDMDFDVLYVPGYYEEAGPIIKQAREMGLDQPILGPDGMGNEILRELAGAENMNDIYYTSHFVVTSEDPAVQEFVSDYKDEFNVEADMFTGLAYDSVYVLKEAIESAESSDPKEVNETLKNITDFPGITGTFSFDEMHDPVKTVNIIEIQDNEEAGVYEVDLDF
ncbi:MAG TPA: ABC transporter substrate-binding protein [Candidatus Atopostipes pullistercoris]|uniref:ABC transporter substrate-binding protein n=1 Tax=Candidatus Atopostipes pullistercoris TaxID=2838467 RepID=A0A9D2JY08_9LACT|nr:ABC transporter substrate-binding protein [Candidatus Atopostipes pullistercoris]